MSDDIDELAAASWLNFACAEWTAGIADSDWPKAQQYLRAVRDGYTARVAQVNRMETQLTNAREFVRLRWRHLADCPEVGSHANAVDLERCNCGLKVALADLSTAK